MQLQEAQARVIVVCGRDLWFQAKTTSLRTSGSVIFEAPRGSNVFHSHDRENIAHLVGLFEINFADSFALAVHPARTATGNAGWTNKSPISQCGVSFALKSVHQRGRPRTCASKLRCWRNHAAQVSPNCPSTPFASLTVSIPAVCARSAQELCGVSMSQ